MSQIATEITDSQLPEPFNELDETQVKTLIFVHDRKPVKVIQERLDVSQRKVYHILDGLLGKKQGVPPKWHCEENYLEKIPRKYSAELRYKLSDLGLQLVSNDIPTKNYNQVEEEKELPESNKDISGDKIRPHWLLSKHEIRNKTNSVSGDAWFVDKELTFDDVDVKEMPDGSVEEFRVVYYDNFKAEIYKNTVNIRIDFPEKKWSPERLWIKYRRKVREIVNHIEHRFPIQLTSKPEHIEACMRGQHWANVDSTFANWLWDNKDEVGDDKQGIQFHVYDQDEELMALVDASHGSPEFEWVHGQEAKNHMSNMKDLIMWGGYYEITPQDFKSLAWMRENKELFENILDRLSILEELESRLDELSEEMDLTRSQVDGLTQGIRKVRSRVDQVEEDVENLSVKVSQVEATSDANSKQIQNNRDKFYEEIDAQNDRIRDAVMRVDSTYSEVQDNTERIADVKDQMDERHEIVQRTMQGLEGKVNQSLRQNQKVKDTQEEILMELKKQREATNQKLDQLTELNQELVEEQKKGFFGKVKDSVSKMNSAVASTVMSIF